MIFAETREEIYEFRILSRWRSQYMPKHLRTQREPFNHIRYNANFSYDAGERERGERTNTCQKG